MSNNSSSSKFRELYKESLGTEKCVLPGSGQEILFRPFRTREEKEIIKVFQTRDLDHINKTVDKLISLCVIEPDNFDVNKLYEKDREFLAIELRLASVGETVTLNLKCPKCKKSSPYQFDVNSFPIKKLEKKYIDYKIDVGKEKTNLQIILNPLMHGKVKRILKQIKVSDIDELPSEEDKENIEESKPSKEKGKTPSPESMSRLVDSAYASLACAIDKTVINGEKETVEDVDEASKILDELSKKDREKIKEYIDSYKFGYPTTLKFNCSNPKCEKDTEIVLSFISFFTDV